MHNKTFAMSMSLIAFALLFAGVSIAQAEPVQAVVIAPAGANDTAITKLLSQKATAADPASLRVVATKVEEGPGFASLTFLEFPSEVAYEQWKSRHGSSIAAPLEFRRLDLLVQHRGRSHDHSASIYKVNAYRSKVAPSAYADYAANYIAPLMEGQIDEDLMLDYGMYIERAPLGEARVWLIVEYRDAATFEATPPIKVKVRGDLTANHAGYAKYDKIKDTLREDLSETLARFASAGR